MMEKIIIRSFVIFIVLLFINIQNHYAQTLQKSIENFTEDLASTYVQPLISGYGADINSGWIQKIPPPKKFEFHVSVGMVFMGSFLNNAPKHFSNSANLTLTQSEADYLTSNYNNQPDVKQFLMTELTTNTLPVNVSGATIAGSSSDDVLIDVPSQTYNYNGQNITLPETTFDLGYGGMLSSVNFFPIFAPQLSIGTLYGTDLVFRYIPHFLFANNNLQNTSVLGIGFQHNPFVWFKNKPGIDVSFGFFYQHLNVQDILTTNDYHFGIYAGKTWGKRLLNFNVYAGVSYERSDANITYTFVRNNYTLPISFDIIGENSFRGTLGLGLKLTIVNINADINFAKYSAISLGANLSY